MIIINGASCGIGKILLEKYIANKFDAVGTFNTTLPSSNINHYFPVDVCSGSSINTFLEEIRSSLKEITLINCSGINYDSFAHKADIAEWEKVIDVNLVGTFRFIHAVLPYMREQNYGRIINLASVVAQKGVPGTSAYAASKSALWGLVKSISVENATKGITVNNLSLGYFNAGMISRVSEEVKDYVKKQIPTHEFGNPEEIFNACEFLRGSAYINGSSIDINGGLV